MGIYDADSGQHSSEPKKERPFTTSKGYKEEDEEEEDSSIHSVSLFPIRRTFRFRGRAARNNSSLESPRFSSSPFVYIYRFFFFSPFFPRTMIITLIPSNKMSPFSSSSLWQRKTHTNDFIFRECADEPVTSFVGFHIISEDDTFVGMKDPIWKHQL